MNFINITGMTSTVLINLMAKIGQRYGTNKKRGTYNSADATAFNRWTLASIVDPGFGPPIPPDEGSGDFPPMAELVVVEWIDCTWGIQMKITAESGGIAGYWSRGNRQEDGQWTGTPGEAKKLHEMLFRIAMDGDWGNDKLPLPEFDEFMEDENELVLSPPETA